MIHVIVPKKQEWQYTISIGENLWKEIAKACHPYSKAVFVTDENIHRLYASHLPKDAIILPPGEEEKTVQNYEKILNQLLSLKVDRKSLIVAVGGGVIGDMAGFAAATYMRGIDYIQVPTTLLAMVDASVGGKVAVNLPMGKNSVGAFYPPKAVFCDLEFLKTIPEKEFLSGLVEVIKHAVIEDAAFFSWLEDHFDNILKREKTLLYEMIEKSIQIKARIVSLDEREGNLRMILNYGHTYGHALESLTGYNTLTHGQAVALGMMKEGQWAFHRGLFSKGDLDRQNTLLEKVLQGVSFPSLSPSRLLDAMRHDKKNQNEKVSCVFPSSIGKMAENGKSYRFELSDEEILA